MIAVRDSLRIGVIGMGEYPATIVGSREPLRVFILDWQSLATASPFIAAAAILNTTATNTAAYASYTRRPSPLGFWRLSHTQQRA